MSFACVNGGHLCTGCMDCQTPTEAEQYILDKLEEAEAERKRIYKELILPAQTRYDELKERLENAEAELQAAQDSIPEGCEDSEEYEKIEQNLDKLSEALDYLIDVASSINEIEA